MPDVIRVVARDGNGRGARRAWKDKMSQSAHSLLELRNGEEAGPGRDSLDRAIGGRVARTLPMSSRIA